jgi:hypothetical protein
MPTLPCQWLDKSGTRLAFEGRFGGHRCAHGPASGSGQGALGRNRARPLVGAARRNNAALLAVVPTAT